MGGPGKGHLRECIKRTLQYKCERQTIKMELCSRALKQRSGLCIIYRLSECSFSNNLIFTFLAVLGLVCRNFDSFHAFWS